MIMIMMMMMMMMMIIIIIHWCHHASSILIGYKHAGNSCLLSFSFVISTDNKQLLDEVEHDIIN